MIPVGEFVVHMVGVTLLGLVITFVGLYCVDYFDRRIFPRRKNDL